MFLKLPDVHGLKLVTLEDESDCYASVRPAVLFEPALTNFDIHDVGQLTGTYLGCDNAVGRGLARQWSG